MGGHLLPSCRLPKLFNLAFRSLPSSPISPPNAYYDWFIYHDYIVYGAMAIAGKWAATFKEFPPVQKPNSFTIDDALKMLSSAATGR